MGIREPRPSAGSEPLAVRALDDYDKAASTPGLSEPLLPGITPQLVGTLHIRSNPKVVNNNISW